MHNNGRFVPQNTFRGLTYSAPARWRNAWYGLKNSIFQTVLEELWTVGLLLVFGRYAGVHDQMKSPLVFQGAETWHFNVTFTFAENKKTLWLVIFLVVSSPQRMNPTVCLAAPAGRHFWLENEVKDVSSWNSGESNPIMLHPNRAASCYVRQVLHFSCLVLATCFCCLQVVKNNIFCRFKSEIDSNITSKCRTFPQSNKHWDELHHLWCRRVIQLLFHGFF